MNRTRMPLAAVLVAALLVSGLVAVRFGRTPSDFVFLLALTFVPFLLLVPGSAAARRHGAVGQWLALVMAAGAGVGMTVLAWGPFYDEIAGSPIAGPLLAPLWSGAAIGLGYAIGCLIEWRISRRRRHDVRACVRCGYPVDRFQKCPECGLE